MNDYGINVDVVRKIHEGRPNVLDYLANGTIDLIVNTPSGKGARTDEGRIGQCCSAWRSLYHYIGWRRLQLRPWNAYVPAN